MLVVGLFLCLSGLSSRAAVPEQDGFGNPIVKLQGKDVRWDFSENRKQYQHEYVRLRTVRSYDTAKNPTEMDVSLYELSVASGAVIPGFKLSNISYAANFQSLSWWEGDNSLSMRTGAGVFDVYAIQPEVGTMQPYLFGITADAEGYLLLATIMAPYFHRMEESPVYFAIPSGKPIYSDQDRDTMMMASSVAYVKEVNRVRKALREGEASWRAYLESIRPYFDSRSHQSRDWPRALKEVEQAYSRGWMKGGKKGIYLKEYGRLADLRLNRTLTRGSYKWSKAQKEGWSDGSPHSNRDRTGIYVNFPEERNGSENAWPIGGPPSFVQQVAFLVIDADVKDRGHRTNVLDVNAGSAGAYLFWDTGHSIYKANSSVGEVVGDALAASDGEDEPLGQISTPSPVEPSQAPRLIRVTADGDLPGVPLLVNGEDRRGCSYGGLSCLCVFLLFFVYGFIHPYKFSRRANLPTHLYAAHFSRLDDISGSDHAQNLRHRARWTWYRPDQRVWIDDRGNLKKRAKGAVAVVEIRRVQGRPQAWIIPLAGQELLHAHYFTGSPANAQDWLMDELVGPKGQPIQPNHVYVTLRSSAPLEPDTNIWCFLFTQV